MPVQRRMISAGLWSQPAFTNLAPLHRLLWVALITQADDQGRMRAHPGYCRSMCFPLDDVPVSDVAAGLQALSELGWILIYESAGDQYLQIASWWKYQQMRWAAPSALPPPPGWTDRVRYRQGTTVLTANWPPSVPHMSATYDAPRPPAVPQASATCTPKDKDKSKDKEKEKDKRREAPPAPRPLDSCPHPEIEVLRALYQGYQAGNGWPLKESIPSKELQPLRDLLDDGYTAPDVEACTRWLRTDPYWKATAPPVSAVHRQIAEWIRQGRPPRMASPPKAAAPTSPSSDAPVGIDALRAFISHGGLDRGN